MIRQLSEIDDLNISLEIIRESFKTVADDFKLTRDNCPSHPSFITSDGLEKLIEKGALLFGLFTGDVQAGFVAVEKSVNDLFYIEKLSVLPQYRHNGYGSGLVRFAFDYIRKNGGRITSIGIMDEHRVLKEWYKSLGFREVSSKKFEHLPFTVCFMDAELSPCSE